MRYLCKKSGSGVKNTLLQDISLFLKEIRKVNHTHCILFFSKRGLSAPLERWNEGRQPLWGFHWKKSPARNSAECSPLPFWREVWIGCLGCGRLRWWWSFGLGQLTARIKVQLRFQSCGWLLWCQKLGEKEGTALQTHPTSQLHLDWTCWMYSRSGVGKEFHLPYRCRCLLVFLISGSQSSSFGECVR